MSDDAQTDDDAAIGSELARLDRGSDPEWSSSLGTALDRERQRRAVSPRPTALWARAGAAAVIGFALLLVAIVMA